MLIDIVDSLALHSDDDFDGNDDDDDDDEDDDEEEDYTEEVEYEWLDRSKYVCNLILKPPFV